MDKNGGFGGSGPPDGGLGVEPPMGEPPLFLKRSLPIILGLILSIAALLAVLRQNPTPPENPVAYLIKDPGAVLSITIKNETGSYTLDAQELTIPGLEEYALDKDTIAAMIHRSVRLVSQGVVLEKTDDPAPFGLDHPRVEVRIRFYSGEEAVFFLGRDAPDGSAIYLKTADNPAIHLVYSRDIRDYFRRSLDFVDERIIPGEALLFDSLTLGGTVRETPIRIIPQADGYRLVSPGSAALSLDRGIPLLQSLAGLRGIVTVKIENPETLSAYGLNPPYSTLALQSFSLRASAPDPAGNVYIQREGVDLIYQVPASKLPWLESSWFDLMEKTVCSPHIETLSAVELITPEGRVSFTLSGTGGDLTIHAGNIPINTPQFRIFYQTLITAVYDLYNDKPLDPGTPPLLEIRYQYRNGKTTDTVGFYPAPLPRRVLTSLNGGLPHYTYTVYMDKVLADLDLILAGKRVAPYL